MNQIQLKLKLIQKNDYKIKRYPKENKEKI